MCLRAILDAIFSSQVIIQLCLGLLPRRYGEAATTSPNGAQPVTSNAPSGFVRKMVRTPCRFLLLPLCLCPKQLHSTLYRTWNVASAFSVIIPVVSELEYSELHLENFTQYNKSVFYPSNFSTCHSKTGRRINNTANCRLACNPSGFFFIPKK